jgi:hypothetical protein
MDLQANQIARLVGLGSRGGCWGGVVWESLACASLSTPLLTCTNTPNRALRLRWRFPPVSLPAAANRRWFTAAMPRDNPTTAVAACAGCATSWQGIGRSHCPACHVTFDDEVLFDAHRRTGCCAPPPPPGSGCGGQHLVPAAGQVTQRLAITQRHRPRRILS